MRTVGLLKNGKAATVVEKPKPAKPQAEEPEAPQAEEPQAEEPKPAKKGGRPTKAELLQECKALGIDADPELTNPELKALIDAAKE